MIHFQIHLLLFVYFNTNLFRLVLSEPPAFFNQDDQRSWGHATTSPPPLGQTNQQPSYYCPPNEPFKNRQLVLQAYIGLATNPKSVEDLFHPDYIQHNPTLPDGRDAVIQDPDPIQGVEFFKTIAEGDLVWTLARLKVFNQSFIAADIFRVECGRIKEHWDVLKMEGIQ